MLRTHNTDPFFSKQPPLRFIEELKTPVHHTRKSFFGSGTRKKDEVDVQGLYIQPDFPDKEGLLETVYTDFAEFTALYSLGGTRYKIRTAFQKTDVFESYTIETNEKETVIRAGDTEGIRRGILHLEDALIAAEGPFLRKGILTRTPRIKTRITRGFFSPTNRPPRCIDELFDDVDYYPDAYLCRLMHDGINGLWIYTRFSTLLPSSFITEYGQESAKRLEKLRQIVKKCARYGIGVYIFAIEPFFFRDAPELKEKYKDALGAEIPGGHRANCLETEFMQGYCEEAGKLLTELVPGLRGWISITVGEGLTHCASNLITKPCPRCGSLPRSRVLANAIDVLRRGFRKHKPETDFISWTYAHRTWDIEEIRDYVQNAPEDCILMQNFEDTVREEQLGKERLGIDYWLSAIGPSERFRVTAEEGRKTGKRIFAKMQVCCSHEVASVPYVPVPGILYKKYKAAIDLGVEGVVQCWYFGNYPSVMSKAAGLLSFMEPDETEEDFLGHLASVYWGRRRKDEISRAWQSFEEGYRQYPLNVLTGYYGPMHDGVIWELALLPKNFSLPRTWMLQDSPDGDRLSDCLGFGHSPEEAEILSAEMSRFWQEGVSSLEKVVPENDEMLSVARALSLLFASGNAIFRFYCLRDRLGRQEGDAHTILVEMRTLVKAEAARSREMCLLCEKDGRLGYHSEAEGYKFFPEKLRSRISKLSALLEMEFPEVEARIEKGLAPLAYYLGEEDDVKKYVLGKDGNAPWEPIGENSAFRAYCNRDTLTIDLRGSQNYRIVGEFSLFSPSPSAFVESDGTVRICAEMHQSLSDERQKKEIAKWNCVPMGDTVRITLNRAAIGWEKDTPFKMKMEDGDGNLWQTDPFPVRTLGKAIFSPGDFGWFMPPDSV